MPYKKTLQPIHWINGFTCPHHSHMTVGLTTLKPGVLECQNCGRTFTQRPHDTSFDVAGGPDEVKDEV